MFYAWHHQRPVVLHLFCPLTFKDVEKHGNEKKRKDIYDILNLAFLLPFEQFGICLIIISVLGKLLCMFPQDSLNIQFKSTQNFRIFYLFYTPFFSRHKDLLSKRLLSTLRE